MKDQFDAVAENGILTKDHVRTALRLIECPRIEALLDRCCLFDLPVGSIERNKKNRNGGSSSPSVFPAATEGSISVAALLAFVEQGSRQQKKSISKQQQQFPSGGSADRSSCEKSPPPAPPPSPPSPLPTTTTSPASPSPFTELQHTDDAHCGVESGSPRQANHPPETTSVAPCQVLSTSPSSSQLVSTPTCADATATAAMSGSESTAANAVIDESSVDAAGVELLSPHVVPLTSKWALAKLAAAAAAAGSKNLSSNTTSTNVLTTREEKDEERFRQNSMSPRSGAAAFIRARVPAERKLGEGGEGVSVSQEESSKRGSGHCTTLVRHLGAVLGLRGKEAYRRPGPGQPVWRKRETLIQERIVQYTTLDEEGTVQELFETEKSQTEVLHMECKRTGEFAHSESTHYESGEAFNGEVVLEEAGVERYVHLRSVDDEYEHLESTLPSRARNGGAAAGVGGNPQAEGVEGGPDAGANENGGDADTVIGSGNGDGGGDLGGDLGDIEPPEGDRDGEQEGCDVNEASGQDGGTPNSRTSSRHKQQQQQQQPPECTGGVGNQGESSPAPLFPPENSTETCSHRDVERSGHPVGGYGVESLPGERGRSTAPGGGAGDKRHRSPSAPPSPYHYRSPSCSPRLSPRPARSPYRQEGVGVRESSGRGESKLGERQDGPEKNPVSSSTSAPGDVDGPRGRVVASGDGGGGGGATATAGVRQASGQPQAGGGGEANLGGHDVWPGQQQLFSQHTEMGPSNTAGLGLQRPPWVEEPEEGSLAGSAYVVGHGGEGEKGSVRSGGFDDGYEGSVVFMDNQNRQGGVGGGQGDEDKADSEGGEDWWHPESGSVLRGVGFSFGAADSEPVAHGKEVDARLNPAQPPTRMAPARLSPASGPSANAVSTKITDDLDDGVNISRLVEGLRSDGPPPPAVSKSEDREGGYRDDEAALMEQKTSGVPSQESTAPAPFHSQDWAGKETRAMPCDVDGVGGNSTLAGVAANTGISDNFSGNDLAA